MIDNNNIYLRKNISGGIVAFIVYLFVLYFLIKYITNNKELISNLMNSPTELLIAGAMTTMISMLLTAILDITCVKVYGLDLSFRDAVIFTFIASAINLILPLQLGSVIKAIYYKRTLHLIYARYLSIVSGTIVINLIVNFIVLLISLLFAMLSWHIDEKYVMIVFLIFVVGIVALFWMLRMDDKLLDMLPFKPYTTPIMTGFFAIMRSRRAMVLCSLNHFLSMVLGGVRFAIIFVCLGTSAGFLSGMLYYALYCASSIVPILPGNIGISEVIMGIMNMLLASDFDIGVTIVLINRIYYYLVAMGGAVLLAIPAWFLYKRGAENTDVG